MNREFYSLRRTCPPHSTRSTLRRDFPDNHKRPIDRTQALRDFQRAVHRTTDMEFEWWWFHDRLARKRQGIGRSGQEGT